MDHYFYVYLLIDPTTNQPFYVGKGTGKRLYEHYRVRNRLTNPLLKNKLQSLHTKGVKPVYDKVLINVSEQHAFARERELITQYGKRIDRTGILCNLSDGGEGATGSWSDERRSALSAKLKGTMGNLIVIRKPVAQYDLNSNLIQSHSSAKEAAEKVPSANRSYITQCCKGKRVSSGGFLWTYVGDPVPTFTKKYYKQVEQYTTEGLHIRTYQSLTHAEEATGVELHNISECCRGKSKTAGGYKWNYAADSISSISSA